MKKYLKIWNKHALLREGEKLYVYKDSLGFLTCGIGHLVRPKDNLKFKQKISKEQSRAFFKSDSAKAVKTSLRQAKEIGIEADWFIAALISANFQLGNFKKKFYGTYPAIVNGEFDKAIRNLRRSDWYKQTPVRVEDIIVALERAKSFKERPLKKTRSIAGGSIAGVSVVAAEVVSEVSEKIEPIADYSDMLQMLFVVLALAGIGLTIYARMDDRKKGYR